MIKIFLSYGHDQYVDLVNRFKDDLVKEGFDVWIDHQNIRGSKDWQEEIENGITKSDWIVLMMTGHAIRRPNGVCLDEIAYARSLGKDVLPIMVQEVKPPLCISRLQYIDLSKHYDENGVLNLSVYQNQFQKIVKYLKKEEEIAFEGVMTELHKVLLPLNNDLYVNDYVKDFYGRKWLFDQYHDWLKNEDSRMFVISGQAGCGKTSIVALMCHTFKEVAGIHFCKYNDSERSNPKRVITSLAYHLASQNKEYSQRIIQLNDLDNLREKSIERLFSCLITEPLYGIDGGGETIVLIIDALDEAQVLSQNQLVNVLVNQIDKLPKWVKFVVTTRPEKEIMLRLKTLNPCIIDEHSQDNLADIRGYTEYNLSNFLNDLPNKQDIIDEVIEKSAGNFLYVKEMCKGIKQGLYDLENLDSFPDGLLNIYGSYFDRLIEEKRLDYKNDLRNLLEVVYSSFQPLPVEIIADILDMDLFDLEELLEKIYVLFPVKNNIVEPIHKSLFDFLIDRNKSGKYALNLTMGHKLIANYFNRRYLNKQFCPYLYKYLNKHLLSSKMYQESLHIMLDNQFINDKIKLFGLDYSVSNYVLELDMLYQKEPFLINMIYESNLLKDLIIKHDKYFYNSGLYFKFDKLGFYEYYYPNIDQFSLELKVIFADYLYITERFSYAVSMATNLLENDSNSLTNDMKAKLYNVCSLSYRKLVLYDMSIKYANDLMDIGDNESHLYEKSLGQLMYGKINHTRLNFQSSYQIINRSIELLERLKIKQEKDSDDAITYELFIAEYYRVLADAAIWNKDLTTARNALDQAFSIYKRLRVKDRYYVRYVYTEAFYQIVEGKLEDGLSKLKNIEKDIISSFDKYQVAFYLGLIYIKHDNLEKARFSIEEGIKQSTLIDTKLEIASMYALLSLIDGKDSIPMELNNNPDIINWYKYIKKFWE